LAVESIKARVDEAAKLKKQLEAKIESINQESRNSVDRLNDIRDQLAQRDITKRNISDNIKYREQLNAIRTLEAKIKEKEKAISAVMNVSDMEDDIDKLEKDYEESKSQVKQFHLLNSHSLCSETD
jgi:predicted patatin/cPLA2 family phospholipase